MRLNLNRPLAFFDLETTGVNVASDRIIEICIIKINPDQSEERLLQVVNPEIPIPLQSSLIHGFYDKDVADKPFFRQVAKSLANFIGNADLAGYNSNKFDIPLLVEEFLRAGVDFELEGRNLVDVQNIFHQMEQRTLKAAYKFYCNRNIEHAHSAEADTMATLEIFKAQLERYKDTPFEEKSGKISFPVQNNMQALHHFTSVTKNADLAGRIVFNEQGEEVFNFGKHTGKTVREVLRTEPSYYAWMMQGDFPRYTKKVLTAIKLREFNK